jgi:hypothetical protein
MKEPKNKRGRTHSSESQNKDESEDHKRYQQLKSLTKQPFINREPSTNAIREDITRSGSNGGGKL